MSLFTSLSNVWFGQVTVQPWTVGLEHRDGRPTRVLPPGQHRRRPRADYVAIDLRERVLTLGMQEVPTADGMTVRISALAHWRVVDPIAFTEVSAAAEADVYLALQIALREAIAPIPATEIAGQIRLLGSGLAEVVRPVAERLGIEVRQVVAKDLLLPAELRAAQAELVLAPLRGQVKLEAARAETAALRSLANGAKVLAENPMLAQLRVVQELPVGSTVELRP